MFIDWWSEDDSNWYSLTWITKSIFLIDWCSKLLESPLIYSKFNALHFHSISRSAEFIALIAVSCTLFLFLHTQSLTSRLREMEDKLQPSEMSASGLSGNSIVQQGKYEEFSSSICSWLSRSIKRLPFERHKVTLREF